MSEPERRGGRGRRPQRVLVVHDTERLTPHLVRVRLGGPGFRAFVDEADPSRLAATDKYVKLLIARPELGLTPPYDLDALRTQLPAEQLPAQRTYTVRAVDPETSTITIDFVVHGDEGVAGPWALNARPGDLLALSGPGGDYHPAKSGGSRFLLLGDDSAIPAIGAALEAMTADAAGTAIIEIDTPADQLPLHHPDGVTLHWVHRRPDPDTAADPAGTALVRAVQALPVPTETVDVFAHGEREAMKAIRAVLQDTWGLDRRAMSLSAYWAAGRAEDRFQAEKREPVGAIFAD